MDLESLPEALQRTVREELAEGETIRWAGQPNPRRFVLATLPVAFFGLFATGFAIYWMAGAFEITQKHKEMEQKHADFDRRWNKDRERWPADPWGERERRPAAPPAEKPGFSFHDLFPLFGLLFVVVGLGMLCSPLYALHKARSTAYVVTDRRVILFEGGWGTNIHTFHPGDLGQVERRQHGDGSGDLILAREQHYVSGHYSGTPGRGGHYVSGGWRTKEIGMFGIPEVKSVHDLIQELAAGTNESRG